MIKYPFPGMGGMGEKSAVELFSSWAEMGKDEGMETGHSPSVDFMISKAVPKLSDGFSAEIGSVFAGRYQLSGVPAAGEKRTGPTHADSHASNHTARAGRDINLRVFLRACH